MLIGLVAARLLSKNLLSKRSEVRVLGMSLWEIRVLKAKSNVVCQWEMRAPNAPFSFEH